MSGWVKFYRDILDWEWYSDANTSRVFIHCLLKANHKPATWRGKDIKRGQFITSSEKLAGELGLTRQKVRTALNNLQSTNEITITTSPQHTVITVNNYENYQGDNQQANQPTNQPTNQRDNQPDNHKQEVQEVKEEKNLKHMSGKPDDAHQKNARSKPPKKNSECSKNVLDYLNKKTGRSFEAVDSNLKLIDSILKIDGRTPELIKQVIDDRVRAWGSDPKMSQYLRPQTIFRESKFSQYVGALGATTAKDNGIDNWLNGRDITNGDATHNIYDGVFTHVRQ